jgi:alpha-tubulin suppressor-like RCC1 family protein
VIVFALGSDLETAFPVAHSAKELMNLVCSIPSSQRRGLAYVLNSSFLPLLLTHILSAVRTHSTFAGGINHFVHIQTDEVYSWGFNFIGQLGLGDTTTQTTPQPVTLSPALSGTPVSVCAGAFFSCVLDSNGDVSCTGSDFYGQIGVGAGEISESLFSATATGVSSVTQLACGSGNVLVTTTTGALKSWGKNSYGQLGLTAVPRVWEAEVRFLFIGFVLYVTLT